MPLYEYECEDCGTVWEAHHSVNHRHDELCQCGKKANLNVTGASIHTFTPYYSKSLGRMITSKAEKRRIMKELHVEEFTKSDEHYIDRAAKENKKRIEEREDKKQLEEFVKSWDKVQAQFPS